MLCYFNYTALQAGTYVSIIINLIGPVACGCSHCLSLTLCLCPPQPHCQLLLPLLPLLFPHFNNLQLTSPLLFLFLFCCFFLDIWIIQLSHHCFYFGGEKGHNVLFSLHFDNYGAKTRERERERRDAQHFTQNINLTPVQANLCCGRSCVYISQLYNEMHSMPSAQTNLQ